MKGLIKKIENAMAATAFAEEGEFETARCITKETDAAEVSKQTSKCAYCGRTAQEELRAV
jgi:hypothetical protein